jgi:hypothetical protein
MVQVHVKFVAEIYTQFSLQRARFGLWGESVGLIPNPNDGSLSTIQREYQPAGYPTRN